MSTLTPKDIEHASGERYQIQSIVGQGGMGTVYLAVNKELGSRVAIKVLNPDIIFNQARMARFRREAALSAQMSHPNIVPVFELQTFGELAYLVMPFIDGVSLEEHLQKTGPLSRDEVERILQQVGDALTYAHGKGVIHRDVKPANILLDKESGRWLLTDFGVAHVAIEGVTELTATDATIGTLSYMAPEQLGSAREVDGRADLYALALVGCEAILGEHPEREGPHETAKRVSDAVPKLPSDWVKVLTWPLASARDERPPDVTVWLERLKDKRSRSRGRLIGVTALTAGVVAIGILGFQLRQTTRTAANPVVAVLPFVVSGNDSGLADLGSVLALGVTRQIQTLPGLQTHNEDAVRTALQQRYGAGPFGIDTLLSLANSLDATEAVIGQATVSAGSLAVRVEVYSPETGRLLGNADVAGPLDSLHAIVSDAVIGAFATRLAATFSGTPAPSLPAGLPAIAAYFRGDLALRRGTLEDAVTQFDRVISADPSFAPAYLKRALALTYQSRPTEAGSAIRPAVDLANQNRDRLDTVSQRLLDAISVLVYDGDMRQADRMLRNIIGEHPNAVDVRFLLGALQARFPALMDATLIEARRTLNEVLLRDPSFGLAYAVLIQIGALLEDETGTRAAIRGYASTDSTSARAEAARLADTLLFRPAQAARITASFPSRPSLVLENIAQAAGVFDPPGGTRPIAVGAIQSLLTSATTNAERMVAGRMQLAAYLGSGEFDRARRFVAEAPGMRIPSDEVDRWIVLSAVTDIPTLADDADIQVAISNLQTTDDDPLTSRWLVARWARIFQPNGIVAADRALRIAAAAIAPDTIDARAFRLDLDALDIVGKDPTVALSIWRAATSRYALDRVAFGLVSSWWPMHLDRIRVAAAMGDLSTTQTLVDHFRHLTGFTDQMAWYPAFTTLADVAEQSNNPAVAREALAGLLRNFIAPTPTRNEIQVRLDLLNTQR